MHVEKAKLENIEADINKIYLNNDEMTPYQSYEFLSISGKGRADKEPLLTLMLKDVNYVLRDDKNRPVMIAPLLIGKDHGKRVVQLRGQYTSAAYLNFLYNPTECTYEMFDQLMSFICDDLAPCTFKLSKIPEKSLMCSWIERKFADRYRQNTEECVTIRLPESYDEWFGSLSKSAKQNIRTAYNRMERENIEVNFNYSEQRPIKGNELDEMLGLYSNRLIQKNTSNKAVASLLYYPVKIGKATNPMTKALANMSCTCHACLYLNNELAACLWALICNDSRVVVPRLSYNAKYRVYCPGGLLIAETIKSLVKSSSGYTELDLSCGNEPYKYTYGGTPHFNHQYFIEQN